MHKLKASLRNQFLSLKSFAGLCAFTMVLLAFASLTMWQASATWMPAATRAQQPTICTTAPNGLVAWYRSENNANDAVGTNNGTLQNGATFASGKVGQAFSFDGTDDYVELLSRNIGQNFSVEFWLNPARSFTNYQTLISNDYRTLNFGEIYQVSGSRISYWVGNSQLFNSSAQLPISAWSHVALTYDGTAARLYINGQLDAFANRANVVFNNGLRLANAFQTQNNTTFFQGQLDEPSVYSRALTAAEIHAIYNASNAGKCVTAGCATPSFAAALNLPVISAGPYDVVANDFNGDGHSDLAAVSFSTRSVSVMLSNANGGFSAAVSYPTGPNPYSIATGDFNADGKLDLAISTEGPAPQVLLNSGTGTFGAAVTQPTFGSTQRVALGDFNADGKLDLFAAGNGSLSIWIGNGMGGFAAPTVTASLSSTSITGLATADFNGDGKLDAAFSVDTGGSGNAAVLLNNGTGGFNASLNVGGNRPAALAVSDFNADGKPDLVISNNQGNSVQILRNNGVNNGTLSFTAEDVSGGGINPSGLITGDFNLDGKRDLAGSVSQSSVAQVAIGSGTGMASARVEFPVGQTPRNIVTGDFNGDGKPDLATVNQSDNNVSVLLNTCGGTPPTNTPPTITAAQIAPSFQQGGRPVGNVRIATASDAETAASNLTVTATTLPPGLSLTNFFNNQGAIFAEITATCNAAVGDQTVVLTVTDGSGATASANLIVRVNANTPPDLPTYANMTVTAGNATTVTPIGNAPADNGTITSLTIAGIASATINATSGLVTVPNSVTAGTYTATISATDNCGATSTRTFTLTVIAATCATAPNGLAAWYRGENNANDASGTNNGTLQNGATFAAGKVGQALSFDGVDDFVATNATLGNFRTNDYSIEFWLRTTATRQEAILGKRSTCSPGSFFDIRNVEGKLYAELNGGEVIRSTVNINDGVFHHIVVQRSAAGLRLYLDGALNNGTTAAGGIADINNDAVFWLGRSACSGNDGTNYFTGQLDEVSVYHRALTAAEVQGLFNAGTQGKCVPTNTAPTITAALALTRRQSSAAGNAVTIATVSDTETAAGNLVVTATTIPTGITISNITNVNGTISAEVAAGCNARGSMNTVVLTVSDGALTATANLLITVLLNEPPTLGVYPNSTTALGNSLTVRPVPFNSDNDRITNYVISATGTTVFSGNLSADLATGDIFITNPRPAGNFNVRVTAFDVCNAISERTFTLTITCPALTVSPATLPNGTLAAAYSQTITASGGAAPYAFTVSSGALPNGLMLTSNGTLSGVATASGNFAFTVRATDANGCTATRDYTLVIVGCPNITISPSTLPLGSPAGTQLIVTGGTAPYAFSLSGALPSGITFSNGLFAGTTTETGNFQIRITATDANGCRAEQTYFIRLGNPPVIIGLNPFRSVAGTAAFTLTLNGASFAPDAVVQWNGSNRVTQFVSARQLRAEITAADIATAGDARITVVNPGPDGGTSNALLHTILPAGTRFEGDVWPRGSGDGKVDDRDVTMMTRFVLRLATPTPGSEFQRADASPRSSLGDRRITTADVVQVRRYAAGLDLLTEAGGPTTPALQNEPTATAENLVAQQTGMLTATAGNFTRGQVGSVVIQINALGTESAVSFTLNYDANKLTFLEAFPSGPLASLQSLGRVYVNDVEPGKVAVLALLPAGQTLPAGTNPIITLRFLPNGGAGSTTAAFTFGDEIIPRESTNAEATAQQPLATTNGNNTVSGNALAIVSAASFLSVAAVPSDSIAAIFGVNLATATATGRTIPLPTELAGTTVTLTDNANYQYTLPLFFVSAGQINCLIPAGVANGLASVTIRNSNGETSTGLLRITDTAPGLFSVTGNGRGLAAAQVLRVSADGTLSYENVARFDSASNQFVPVPIDLSNASEQVFLVLYGTGLRARSDLSEVIATLGGSINGEVLFAGAQGSLTGLDQVNVRLPRGLVGRGNVDVALSVDGKAANTVQINVR